MYRDEKRKKGKDKVEHNVYGRELTYKHGE